MLTIAATKRHRNLNIHLSDILHQYLLACDSLYDDPLADIDDHLSLIQKAVFKCRHIMLDYKEDHEGGAK